MITNVKSLLVSSLTSKTTTNVDDMVTFAAGAFTMLSCLESTYDCFYRDVKDLNQLVDACRINKLHCYILKLSVYVFDILKCRHAPSACVITLGILLYYSCFTRLRFIRRPKY